MQINSIEINNFRCWEHVKLTDFKKYNVFIGENSVGKSTILECLRLLDHNDTNDPKNISRGKQEFSVNFSLKFSKKEIDQIFDIKEDSLVNRQFKRDLEFFYKLLENSEFSFMEEFRNNSRGRRQEPVKIIVQDTQYSFSKYLKIKTTLASGVHINLNHLKSEILNNEGLLRKYTKENIIQIVSRRTINRESTQASYSYNIVNDGKMIKRLLHNAKNSDSKILKQGFKKFQEIVSEWSFTPGEPDIKARSGDNIDLIFWINEDENITIEEVGDGIKEAVIIAGICLIHPNHIILIEEPERH
ncbi:MAG: AAA family ATPase, partial [Candidatus Hodarchaeales archaeon]